MLYTEVVESIYVTYIIVTKFSKWSDFWHTCIQKMLKQNTKRKTDE